MKKILALFLLLLSLFHHENLRAYDFCVDGIYYNVLSLEELTLEVTQGDNKYCGNVIIPQTVEYKERIFTVVKIGAHAFSDTNRIGESELNSIDLPIGLVEIGDNAFESCSLIETVTIPSTVSKIGTAAFCRCSSLRRCHLPDGLKSIATSLFSGCISLLEIDWPKYLETIEYGAFNGCSSLNSIKIGPSVSYIGKYAFCDCENLSTIIIEDNEDTLIINKIIFSSNLYSRKNVLSLYLGRNISITQEFLSFKELIIGEKVTVLGAELSFGNTKSIICLGNEPPILKELDNSVYMETEVIVPQGKLSTYKSAESWKKFWNIHEKGSSTENPNTCNKPTIDYIEGKLCINSTTPNSKCYYSIKDNDIVNNNIVDGEIDLSATYTITAYASAEGYERSSLSTATLCWIEGSFETDGIETPFVSRKAAIIAVENGVVSVSGLDEGCLVQSISIDGRIIDRSVAKDGIATLNAEQCAIIKIADKSIKIVEQK